MTTTLPHREQAEIVYVIRHPGTGEPQTCDTFEEAMDKWFEGYNLPRLVVDGKMEEFSDSYARVKAYYDAASNLKRYYHD